MKSKKDIDDILNMKMRLEALESVEGAVKSIAHAKGVKPETKRLLESVLALVQESWIAESGQESRSAQEVVSNVEEALSLFDLVAQP